MHRRHCCRRRGVIAGALIGLASVVGLTGCFRGGWHDPERIEKRADSIIADVKEDLELRPEQARAFDALSGKIKTSVVERTRERREIAGKLKTEFAAKQVDSERVATLLKEHLALHADRGADQGIVDEAAAFYRTLDAKQQETVNKKVRRFLDWHD
jgi:hypothetical protein